MRRAPVHQRIRKTGCTGAQRTYSECTFKLRAYGSSGEQPTGQTVIDVEGHEAVPIVVVVEQGKLLVAVHAVRRGVHIDDDALGGDGVTVDEVVHEAVADLHASLREELLERMAHISLLALVLDRAGHGLYDAVKMGSFSEQQGATVRAQIGFIEHHLDVGSADTAELKLRGNIVMSGGLRGGF